MSTPVVEIAREATSELVDAFARLIPQLSKSSPPPTRDELDEMITSPASDVLIAKEGDDILGALTLIVFRIPTGVRAWIEDVVVDDAARGKGVGDLLNRFALQLAASKGAEDGRPHLAPVAGGGEPPLPTHRLRAARHERVPLHAGLAAVLTKPRPASALPSRSRARSPLALRAFRALGCAMRNRARKPVCPVERSRARLRYPQPRAQTVSCRPGVRTGACHGRTSSAGGACV